MFIGAPGTTAPGSGGRTPYAICVDGGRFTGVPTAETKGPPIGCPMLVAPYIPTPGGAADAGVGCLLELPAAEPFDWPVIGP